jgi:hypothetical protein
VEICAIVNCVSEKVNCRSNIREKRIIHWNSEEKSKGMGATGGGSLQGGLSPASAGRSHWRAAFSWLLLYRDKEVKNHDASPLSPDKGGNSQTNLPIE